MQDEVAKHTADIDGIIVEHKPAGVAVHYRTVTNEQDVEKVVERILKGPVSIDGVHLRTGKMVLELSVIESNKGVALESLRSRFGATTALYFGDDETDEDAFARGCAVAARTAVESAPGFGIEPIEVPIAFASIVSVFSRSVSPGT